MKTMLARISHRITTAAAQCGALTGVRSVGGAMVILVGMSVSVAGAATHESPAPAVAKSPVAAQQKTPAEAFRDSLYGLQAFLANKANRNPGAVKQYVMKHIRPRFDMQRMAQLAAGPYYAKMTPAQRRAFTGRLEGAFFERLTEQVVSQSKHQPRIQFLKMRRNKQDKLVDVLARVLYPDGRAKRLVFRFADSDKGWRVYDVAANGQSAALYFRQYFSRLARRNGPERLLQ